MPSVLSNGNRLYNNTMLAIASRSSFSLGCPMETGSLFGEPDQWQACMAFQTSTLGRYASCFAVCQERDELPPSIDDNRQWPSGGKLVSWLGVAAFWGCLARFLRPAYGATRREGTPLHMRARVADRRSFPFDPIQDGRTHSGSRMRLVGTRHCNIAHPSSSCRRQSFAIAAILRDVPNLDLTVRMNSYGAKYRCC